MRDQNYSYSRWALVVSYVVILYAGVFYYPKWNKERSEATISWDASGYYMYLPAFFIYKDMRSLAFKDYMLEKYQPTMVLEQAFLHPSGNYVMKYSSGQALTFAPFFLAGHAAAKLTSYPKDGYSFPYQLAIGIGALFYALLGLFLLRKVLIRFFSDKATAVTMLAIAIGTNYLNYAAIDGAMTHNTLFTIYSGLLLATISFYRAPSFLKAALIGFLTGLATLIRPTEVIAVLIPLLWGIGNKAGLFDRFRFARKHMWQFVVAGICFAAMVSIQLIYWKLVAHEWVVYSYQDQSFSFFHPHLWSCLFSYRSGWLTYTPIMVFALIGFVPLYKKNRTLFLPLFVFAFLFMYVCFSWDIWWYGGSLGQRAMVQCYPVLAFPFAALVEFVFRRAIVQSVVFFGVLVLFTLYNLWLTHQGHLGGLLRVGEMNRQYFWAILGRSERGPEYQSLLDNDVLFTDAPRSSTMIYQNDFDTEDSSNVVKDLTLGKSLLLDGGHPTSKEYEIKVPSGTDALRAEALFIAGQKEWDNWRMHQFVLKYYNSGKPIASNMIRVFRQMGDGETKTLFLDSRVPKEPFDRVTASFNSAGSDKELFIDNLKVWALQF